MQHLSLEMRTCIEECLRCHATCLGMAMNHCPEQGGKHVEPSHMRLMLACAEICEECARSCEQVGGMEECVQACRRCAESCRKMAA